MDVNATLRMLRDVLQDTASAECGAPGSGDLAEVREAFAALDNWLCRGGALPDAWNAHR